MPRIAPVLGAAWLLVAALAGCGRSFLPDVPGDDAGSAADVADAGAVVDDASLPPADGSMPGSDVTIDVPSFVPDAPGTGDEVAAPFDAGAACGTTCAGCCEGTICISGGWDDSTACGITGFPCIACSPGFSCMKGSCVQPVADCGPSNCAGCCTHDGSCAEGVDVHACGTGGNACTGCTHEGKGGTCEPLDAGGGVCNGVQACNTDNCNFGCCNGDFCEQGTSDTACGALATACVVCPTGQSCVNNGCQSPPFCSASNCGTCCQGNQCVTGDADQACGEQSEPCQDCASRGLVCQNHQCVPGCSPSNCTGCCDGNVCAQGNQDLACGSGGVACQDCTQHHGTCVNDACSF